MYACCTVSLTPALPRRVFLYVWCKGTGGAATLARSFCCLRVDYRLNAISLPQRKKVQKMSATMVNIPDLAVTVKMGGKVRRFMFDLLAWSYVEDHTGLAINDDTLWQNLTFQRILIIVKAALLHESPDISLKELGGMFDASGVPVITKAIRRAMEKQSEKGTDGAESPLGEVALQAPAQ